MIEFNATLIVCMISFVIFMFIMNMIFYRPILEIIQKRQEYFDLNNEKAESCVKRAKDADSERESKLAGARESISQELKSDLESVRSESDSIIKNEKSESKRLIDEKKASLLVRATDMRNELSDVIDSIADEMVKKAG